MKRYLILPDAHVVSELRGAAGSAVLQSASRSLKQVGEHAAEQAEKAVVLDMLEETGWNRKESARLLNIFVPGFSEPPEKMATLRGTTPES